MLNYLIYFLIVSGLSIRIGSVEEADIIEEDLQKYFDYGRKDFAQDTALKFKKNCRLGGGGNAIVWRGSYGKTPVAIKVVWNKEKIDRERAALWELKAMTKSDIENFGIPKVYFSGEMLGHYDGIAMTLFEGSLYDVYRNILRRPLSEIDVLQIFKQAVETLKYLHKKNVIHNDIKPENMFFRGNKVFIGDFDLASIGGRDTYGGTFEFASANYHGSRQRTAMDDLESLIYSLWHISGIKLGKKSLFGPNLAEGQVMNEIDSGKALDRVTHKISKFKDPHVRQVFTFVCEREWLSGNRVPDYELIIGQLEEAIDQLGGQRTFAWLSQSSSSR